MTPSTSKTICTGVVLVAAAAFDGTSSGSLAGATLAGTSRVPAWKSKVSVAVNGAFSFCMAMFALPEVVLIQHTHAVRAFLAVTERIESVAVAQDHPPHLAPRSERETGAHARVPVAGLFESGQIINIRTGGTQTK